MIAAAIALQIVALFSALLVGAAMEDKKPEPVVIKSLCIAAGILGGLALYVAWVAP